MSLTERLRKIEADIAELKKRQAEMAKSLDELVIAIEQDGEVEEDVHVITLDGESAGSERDQDQTL